MANRRHRNRTGDYTCRCPSYAFPHRFGGGKCHGAFIAAETWDECFGGGICSECHALDKSEDNLSCQVVSGQENVTWCAAWREFVQSFEIVLYAPLRKWAEQS